MNSPLLAALAGKCPACRQGRLYEGFLLLHELCPRCGVRYERYVGTRTIATVLSFGVGAILVFGIDLILSGIGDDMRVLMGLGVALGAVLYPVFQRVALFLLWQNGLVTVDPAPEASAPAAVPLPEPFAPVQRPILALPPEDDPTWGDDRAPAHDDPTDERER